MPKLLGDDGRVLVGANVINDTVSFDCTFEGDRIESTTQTDTNKTYRAGKPDVSGTIVARFDETDTNGQAVLTQGAQVTLVLRPGGTGSGLPELSGLADIISRNFSSELGGIVSLTCAFAAAGPWTETLQA